MSTRSYIGIRNRDNSVSYIYCHHDGYPEYNGEILYKHYKAREVVESLLELGSISVLGEYLNTCIAYNRDMGYDMEPKYTDASIEEAVKEGDAEWMYVFELDNSWSCTKVDYIPKLGYSVPTYTEPLIHTIDKTGVY